MTSSYFFVGVGAGEELDDGEGHPVRHHALHLPQIVELCETVLERLGDEAFEVFRVGAGQHRRDVETGDLEGRVLFARDRREAVEPDRDQAQERDQRELVASDREFKECHRSVPRRRGCR